MELATCFTDTADQALFDRHMDIFVIRIEDKAPRFDILANRL